MEQTLLKMTNERPVVHGAMGCDYKKLYASVEVPPDPIGVPSPSSLAPSPICRIMIRVIKR